MYFKVVTFKNHRKKLLLEAKPLDPVHGSVGTQVMALWAPSLTKERKRAHCV